MPRLFCCLAAGFTEECNGALSELGQHYLLPVSAPLSERRVVLQNPRRQQIVHDRVDFHLAKTTHTTPQLRKFHSCLSPWLKRSRRRLGGQALCYGIVDGPEHDDVCTIHVSHMAQNHPLQRPRLYS